MYPFAPSSWRQSRGDIIRTVETYVSRGPRVWLHSLPRSVVAGGIERRREPGFCARAKLAGAALSHPIQRIASVQRHRRNPRGCPHEEKDKRGINRNYSYISKYRSSITRACVSMLLFGEIGIVLSGRKIRDIVDCNWTNPDCRQIRQMFYYYQNKHYLI